MIEVSQTFFPLRELTIMIGPQNGHRASIPEINTRYAADYSREISLRLLEDIEKTVDSLTVMEHAPNAVTGAVHAAERSWDEVEAPAKMPDDTDQHIDILDKSAEALKRLGEVYLAKKQAARNDHSLQGENEDLVVGSYDRAINRTCNALQAVESLKWTLMDLQALSEPVSKSYDSAEELLADLKA